MGYLLLFVIPMAAGACAAPQKPAGYSVQLSRPEVSQAKPKSVAQMTADSLETASAPDLSAGPLNTPIFAVIPKEGEAIGGKYPMALEAMSSTGHWVAFCRVENDATTMPLNERGEPMGETSLVLHQHGKTSAIDALLAMDEGGRFVVTLEGGRAWLHDTGADRRWDLSVFEPDLRSDALPDHRSFSFAGGGLVILTHSEKNEGVYLKLPAETNDPSTPLSNAAARISFGQRPVWRLFSHGSSLSAVTVRNDSSDFWPVPKRSTPPRRCRATSHPFSAFGKISAFRPDPSLETLWLDLSPAKIPLEQELLYQATPAPGFVMAVSDSWVRRLDNGRLLLVRDGTQKQIASAKCGARILHVDEESGLFLIACEEYTPVVVKNSKETNKGPTKYRFDLHLVQPGFVRGLRADVARTGVDLRGQQQTNLFPLRPGAEAALVDFKARKLWPLESPTLVLATSGIHALLREQNTLSLWTSGKQEQLEFKAQALSLILSAGPTVAVEERVYLLGETLKSWSLPAPPLAITREGYALVPQHAVTSESWPIGPFVLLGPPVENDTRESATSRP